MYDTCPKCQHQRQSNEQAEADSCPACGLIYSKWLKSQISAAKPELKNTYANDSARQGLLAFLASWLFYIEEKTNSVVFWGRTLLYAGLLAWGGYVLSKQKRNLA